MSMLQREFLSESGGARRCYSGTASVKLSLQSDNWATEYSDLIAKSQWSNFLIKLANFRQQNKKESWKKQHNIKFNFISNYFVSFLLVVCLINEILINIYTLWQVINIIIILWISLSWVRVSCQPVGECNSLTK